MDGAGGGASPGLDVRALDGQLIVTSVDARLARGQTRHPRRLGDRAHRRPGDRAGPEAHSGSVRRAPHCSICVSRAPASAACRAPPGSSSHLDLLDGDGRAVAIDVERAMPRGKLVSFGNLPAAAPLGGIAQAAPRRRVRRLQYLPGRGADREDHAGRRRGLPRMPGLRPRYARKSRRDRRHRDGRRRMVHGSGRPAARHDAHAHGDYQLRRVPARPSRFAARSPSWWTAAPAPPPRSWRAA